MKLTGIILAAMTGVSVGGFTAPSFAQDNSTRDAAIHRCIIQAQRQFPDATSDSVQQQRTASYKACMTAAGLAP